MSTAKQELTENPPRYVLSSRIARAAYCAGFVQGYADLGGELAFAYCPSCGGSIVESARPGCCLPEIHAAPEVHGSLADN